jgi:hypothetical protein
MKISHREQWLISIASASLFVALTWYIVDLKLPDYRAHKIEIDRIEHQLVRDQRRISMQQDWIDQLEILQQELRIFKADDKSIAPQLMQAIKVISDRHQLDITRNQPYAEKPTGNLYEMDINCTWQGNLAAITGFLVDLQQQGVRYDVRTLNILPNGKKKGQLKGTMLIQCAYIKGEL